MTFDSDRAAAVAARNDRADALHTHYRAFDPRRRWLFPRTWFRRAAHARAIAELLQEPLS